MVTTINDELRGILEQLLARAREDKVRWKPYSDAYSVTFPDANAEIFIKWRGEESAPDWAMAELSINHRPIGRIRAEEGEDDYELIHELYVAANRYAVGWDAVIGQIKKQLAGGGPVGDTKRADDIPSAI